MADPKSTPAAKPATKPGRKPGEPQKSYVVTLAGGQGETLQFTAAAHKDGSFGASVTHRQRDAAGKIVKSVRGASVSNLANLDAAKGWVDKAVAVATKQGWVRRAFGPGIKADAFTLESLPKPAAK